MSDDTITKELQEDVARLVDDLKSLRRELGASGRAGLEHLRDEAKEKIATAREQASEKFKQVDTYAHEKPWVAAGVAAAAGAVLGAVLLTWRNRR